VRERPPRHATPARHRAQGRDVDRTFVLGSDELYREWGYTALSRTDEARFYVSATPDFLNQAPAPLTADDRSPTTSPASSATVARTARPRRLPRACDASVSRRTRERPRAARGDAHPARAASRRTRPDALVSATPPPGPQRHHQELATHKTLADQVDGLTQQLAERPSPPSPADAGHDPLAARTRARARPRPVLRERTAATSAATSTSGWTDDHESQRRGEWKRKPHGNAGLTRSDVMTAREVGELHLPRSRSIGPCQAAGCFPVTGSASVRFIRARSRTGSAPGDAYAGCCRARRAPRVEGLRSDVGTVGQTIVPSSVVEFDRRK